MKRLTAVSLLLMASSFESGDPLLAIPAVSAAEAKVEAKVESKNFYSVNA